MLAFFSTLATSTVAMWVIRFLAFKAILVVLMTITLPIILHNVIYWFFDVFYNVISNVLFDGSIPGAVLTFTGVAGYLAVKFRLVDCLAVLLTALSVRSVINFIPFIR